MRKPIFDILLALTVLLGAAGAVSGQDTSHVARDTAAARSGNFIFMNTRMDSTQANAWNSPKALALVEEARARRLRPRSDSGLRNYHTPARGYVYFFLDRNASPEKTLVKVDQLALDVYWAAPNLTKQKIVGMRDVSRLPNKMYYHLDHLTVVQNEFADIIQLGEGDEVRTVLHPAAPGAETMYQYRVADSLTLRLPGNEKPVEVYELAVRPKNVKAPAFIGSMYVDQRTGAIVRMTFTFTRASYVDRRLDYINVSLENGLFEGQYWLPHEQRIEIRRQVPELDFPAGAVIRGVFRIGPYELNQPLPPGIFTGPPIEASTESERKSFPFEEGIYADLNDAGLAPPPDMAALRAQAAQLVRQRYLSGLPKLRLHLGPASSAFRYDRAEGFYLGGGATWAPAGTFRLDGMVGYATSAQRVSFLGDARASLSKGTELRASLFANALRDIGLRPAVAGALNTLSSAFLGTDYLDPYRESGGAFEASHPLGPWTASLRLAAARQKSAWLAESTAIFRSSTPFRPVRPIDEGTALSARASLGRVADESGSFGWGGTLALEQGSVEGRAFTRPTLQASLLAGSKGHRTMARLNAEAGAVLGTVPAQRLFLIGGPGTLPGYDIRSFAGDRFALGNVELTRDLFPPFVRLRATASAGWTGFGSSKQPAGWTDATTTGRLKTSVGAGVGLGWDIVRLDLARGLSTGGRWQLVLSVHPELRDIL